MSITSHSTISDVTNRAADTSESNIRSNALSENYYSDVIMSTARRGPTRKVV